jgi:hypothetical protein
MGGVPLNRADCAALFSLPRGYLAAAVVPTTVSTLISATGIPTGMTVCVARIVIAMETVTAPAVAIAPTPPRSDTDEDAIVKELRTPKSILGTGIRRVVVVTPLTHRRSCKNYIDIGLCCGWREHQDRRKDNGTGQDAKN